MRPAHTRPQRKGRGGSNSTRQSFTSLRTHGFAERPTVRHGAHHPLSSECTQQASAQSPSCHPNGNTNNRRRKPSMPLAGKKKWGHVSRTASRGTVNGTRRHTATVDTVTMEARCSELPKKGKSESPA
ncbi:hypothetical protein TcCL_Unassigned01158 [Trypanosoma cruzi]|nr:hypothetical protein TcCL_Unassigned01158 [Trypanosoma cruzi]